MSNTLDIEKIDLTTHQSLEKVQEYLRKFNTIMVAYSGGIDSALMLKIAIDTLGVDKVLAITSDSASYSAREKENAVQFAEQIGARHLVIQGNEFNDKKFLANQKDRCFHCKSDLYSQMVIEKERFNYDCIVNGANFDDLGDYRPGHIAAEKYQVLQPFADLGINKTTIREIARQLNVPFWEKPASPCLSSRVPYNQTITPDKMSQIEKAEDLLHSLGFKEFRVRHYGNLAKIEVQDGDFVKFNDSDTRDYINTQYKKIGFTFVSLDLSVFQSGNLNKDLDLQ